MRMENKKDILSQFAKEIVDRGASVPAIFFLESTKYISFVGSQFLVFLGPIATSFVNTQKYYQFTELLEERDNIEYVISEIERLSIKVAK